MTSKRVAVDTNVLIYLHDTSNLSKRAIAKDLLAEDPYIPAQVVSEYLNTAKRLLSLSKEDLLTQTSGLLAGCQIIPIQSQTLTLAASLVKLYKFQLFDSIIVAAAIEANCDILYTEDMHNGLVVNKTLTIVNPFL